MFAQYAVFPTNGYQFAYMDLVPRRRRVYLAAIHGCVDIYIADAREKQTREENMIRKITLLVMASFISPAVTAQTTDPKIHWCDGCSIEQEREAVKTFTDQMGNFYYYVGNLPAQTIHKYTLARGWDKPPCSGRPGDPNCIPPLSVDGAVAPAGKVLTYVYDSTVENDIADAFSNAMQFYYTEPAGWKKQYDIQFIDPTNPQSLAYRKFYRDGRFVPQASPGIIGPLQIVPVVDFPDPNANVYDVAGIGAKQNQFLDYFLSPGGQQFQVASNYLLKVVSFVRLFDAEKLPATAINVTFADGSKIRIMLDTSTTSPHYVIDESSGRDSHGNFVPIRQSQLQDVRSTFSFGGAGNPNDRPNSYQQLRWLGIDMGGVSPSAESWGCGPSAGGGAGVTCTQIR